MSRDPSVIADKQKRVDKVSKFNEKLVEFHWRKSCIFEDPEYGEFKCMFQTFLAGNGCHRERRQKRVPKNRITEEEAKKRLKKFSENKEYSVTLVEYGGAATKVSTFMDSEYGEFTGKLNQVLLSVKNHPERGLKKRLDIISSEEWAAAHKSGIRNVDWENRNKKLRQTFLDRYGKEHALQVPEFQKKRKETSIEKYGKDHFCKTREGSARIKEGQINSGFTHVLDGRTLKEHADSLGKAYTTFQAQVKKYGFEIAKSITLEESGLEKLFSKILDKHDLNYETQYSIQGKRADFKLNNLIVECDGLYYHSDLFLHKEYHKDKKDLYEKEGFSSLFFREDEIINKPEIIESILLNKLGKTPHRVFARKCRVEEIPKDRANTFFSENHLMGKGRGRCFGLVESNNLLSAVRIVNHKNLIKIDRFCNKINHSVVGGFGKLLKKCLKEYNKDVEYFVDCRYGSGDFLTAFGFQEQSNHLSFKWVKGLNSVHRLKFKGNTGYEHGYRKLWDCGQKKFILPSN